MDGNEYDELNGMFSKLMDLYDLAYEDIKRDVEYIILNGIRDEYIIEKLFDNVINIPTDKCYKLFVDLCAYVSRFNKEIVNDYIEVYNDLYGDDGKENDLTI